MPQNYTPEFKKKIIRLRLEEGRTINSITTEYGISKESIHQWCSEFQKECQAQSLQTPSAAKEADIMKENLRLRKELAEKEKEILFLKKVAAFFAKEIDYRLIGLSNNITGNLASASSCTDSAYVQTLITTIGNTRRRIITSKNRLSRHRYRKSTTSITEWMVIEP